MNYNLNQLAKDQKKASTFSTLRSLLQLIAHEKGSLSLASVAILFNALFSLLGPYLIGYAIDNYINHRLYNGLFRMAGILLALYLAMLATSYFQTKLMGSVSQRMLFTLRNALFHKLLSFPVEFFNVNKAGDLISRINNDTDKINTFFSQSLVQFISSIVIMFGSGIFLLTINMPLGAATLVPALFILIFTRVVSPWVKRKNASSLKSTGGLSAEIQESLDNFKVIVAFNRRDYFRKRFAEVNMQNYKDAIRAGMANNMFLPVYTFFSALAQLIVLTYGIYLINSGHFSVGLLISYLAYTTQFYNPLRQLAVLWSSFQIAMAGWDRISGILSLSSHLQIPASHDASTDGLNAPLLEFKQVSFGYTNEKQILKETSLQLDSGKTYAFVGPTGGGKTTTASLIARLYDPISGTILFRGKDLRSYTDEERSQKIGFILQEPFIFSGTVKDNILYGNSKYQELSGEELEQVIEKAHLGELLSVFDQGLNTEVSGRADNISLGQKQLVAFMRAVLRRPEILILDEATANIDTVTENLLEDILAQLPSDTTRIIIAHRLNTIENADEIFFINSGKVELAGSFKEAVDKLMSGKRES